jgi:hypothetical protein
MIMPCINATSACDSCSTTGASTAETSALLVPATSGGLLHMQKSNSRPGRSARDRILFELAFRQTGSSGSRPQDLFRYADEVHHCVTFAYLAGTPPARAVSVTMPMESWSVPFGLLPIFEMNLPEGVLRERLRLAFAKATGTFDEFDLLSIVCRLAGWAHSLYRRQGATARGRAFPVCGRNSRTQTRRRSVPLSAG